MAKIIHMFSSMDDDLREFNEKIWKHRTALAVRFCILLALVVGGIFGIRYYINNRSFTGYSVSSVTERTDAMNTKYEFFGGKILKYSRDGISYTDEKDTLLFSITYTMQSPMLALSGKAGAVADKNGSQIYIFDQQKQMGQITTLLPIKNISVSDQGIVAVLMEDTDSSKLEIYSSEGILLGDGVFSLEDAGYPMDLSISADGKKLGVSFVQTEGSVLTGSVAVYNFDNVGENYIDHLVFAQSYKEYMIPEVRYFGNNTLVAVGDGILGIYQGSQIPEVVKEITFEEKIKSVFYGENQIALVFEGETGSLLRLYDLRGNVQAEVSFDLNYDKIRITEQSILVYNASEMGVYSYNGKECFRYTLEESVLDIFTRKSRNKYLLVYPSETQQIKLQ